MANLFDLTGKVAIVTGASSGLGADAARAYAEAGADVALLARREERLQALAAEIEQNTGRKALPVRCDVRDEENVKAAVQAVMDTFGHIDILLNDAGATARGGVDSLTQEQWDLCFDTNAKGIFLMCKYVVPHMKAQKYGKIVNIASLNAFVGEKPNVFIRHAYNASKGSVIGLTRGMACSYARHGITVNAICPGLFESEMTIDTLLKSRIYVQGHNSCNPTGRPANRGELNGTVLYLSSDASSYVQGQAIAVDGGFMLV